MSLFYKPLELLGNGLRNLSLSGNVANIVAIIIYGLVSLIPVFVYIILKNKKSLVKMDRFLIVISGMLFFVIYYLINPTLFMANGLGNVTLIGMFYSILVGYLVLRGISVWTKADVTGLQKGIRFLIYLLMIAVVGAIAIECLENLPTAIQALKDGNTMATDPWAMFESGMPSLTITVVFLVLRCIVRIVPYSWELFILGMILKLVQELGKDRYSEAVVKGFNKLGIMCKRMLVVTMVLNMGFALLQVMFRSVLYQINMDVTIPLVSIVLVLAVMMVAKYVKETQEMKEELDMFI